MSGAENLQPDPNHRQLRVCLVVDTMGYDAGTEKLVAEFAKRMDPARCELHVCCFENSSRLASLPSHVCKIVFPLVRLYSPAGLRQVLSFRRYIRRNRIDLVHGFMTKSNIFAVLGGLRSPCVIVTSRLNIGYWYTPRLLLLFRFLNRSTTHILTNSVCAKNTTVEREKVPPEKISVVYPGVDLAQFDSSKGNPQAPADLGIPAGVPVVGIVATFRAVKDLPLFLRAARLVHAAKPQTAFLLVGHGQLKEELETLAAELGIRQNVFLTNGRGAVPDYLARMSVACLTSQSESLPNAILEYLAAGLPVVATDVGGIGELVKDGVNGYLVRSRTPEAVAEPIIRLLTDETLRAKMGGLGLERGRSEFDMSAATMRLEDFYSSAVAAGKASGEASL
ncbi:MAG: glycosyltransferase family 4 protein [Acidobacteriota bacterium]|nr:glycosyltransferase family 4 protein [Acidobacteriota bacterium]